MEPFRRASGNVIPLARRLTAPARAIFALLLVTLVACGPEPSTGAPATGPSGSASRDGIIVTLTLDRAPLPSGTSSRALVTVVNSSSEPRLWQGGGCDFPATIAIDTAAEVTPPKGRLWQGTAGQFKGLLRPDPVSSRTGSYVDERFAHPTNVACPADLGVNSLGPGHRLMMTGVWDGQVNGVAAVAGAATVRATFPYLGRGAGQAAAVDPSDLSNAITVTLPVEVSPPPGRLLSPGEAIDAALTNPEFGAWLAKAGPMQAWDGVDMEVRDGVSVVILYSRGEAGRASVDRWTGAVSFEVRARP